MVLKCWIRSNVMRMVVLRRMSDAILVIFNVVVMMCCWSLGKNMSRAVSVSVGGLGIR